MKTVIKTIYKPMIISTVILCVLVILNSMTFIIKGRTYKGILQLLGSAAMVEQKIFNNYQEYEKAISMPRPEIQFRTTGLEDLCTDKSIQVLKYFKISYQGQSFAGIESIDERSFKVMDITNSKGSSIMHSYDQNKKEILFSTPGIYTFKFYIKNEAQKDTTAIIRVPVS